MINVKTPKGGLWSLLRAPFFYSLASGLSILFGCSANLHILPKIDSTSEEVEYILQGKLDYKGNPAYLPRTIRQTQKKNSHLVLRYQYEETHSYSGHLTPTGLDPISHYNTVGEKRTVVKGKLEVIHGSVVLKAFKSQATLFGQGDFLSETLTEMRIRGLVAVRDNIDSQILQEKENLENLLHLVISQ